MIKILERKRTFNFDGTISIMISIERAKKDYSYTIENKRLLEKFDFFVRKGYHGKALNLLKQNNIDGEN